MDPISAIVVAAGKALVSGGASTFLTAAGTGLSAYGAYASGKAQQAASEYNADLQKQQAMIAREDAAENIRRREQDQKRALARMRAQYGGQGLAEGGAVNDMLGYTAGKFELELADMFTAAERRATAYENSASLYRYEGRQQGTSGVIGGLSALAGGASDFALDWSKRKDLGI